MTAPLVSIILATNDRPTFLPIALRCYAEQTCPDRELIVVDSGAHFPVDEALVDSVGGRVLRVPPGTPLGQKLNLGIASASGLFIQKMDDDDYYAPTATERLIDALGGPALLYTPRALAGVSPYSLLLLKDWDLRYAPRGNTPGATLCFPRALWEELPFAPVRNHEDSNFMIAHHRIGNELRRVPEPDLLISIRHTGIAVDRAHIWVKNASRGADDYDPDGHIKAFARHRKRPEDVLPAWALDIYQRIRSSSVPGKDEE